jgi:hypothetical protein
MLPLEGNTVPGKVNETVPLLTPLNLDDNVQSHFQVFSVVSPRPNPLRGSPDPPVNMLPEQFRGVHPEEIGLRLGVQVEGMRMSTQ